MAFARALFSGKSRLQSFSKNLVCCLSAQSKHFRISQHIRNFQIGQTMLAVSEEISGASLLQILVCNFETIPIIFHNCKPVLCRFAFCCLRQEYNRIVMNLCQPCLEADEAVINRSAPAFSTTIIVALGTSTPTSITVVETRILILPSEKASITFSCLSLSFFREEALYYIL